LQTEKAQRKSNELIFNQNMSNLKEANNELNQNLQRLRNENNIIEKQISELDVEIYKVSKEISILQNSVNFNDNLRTFDYTDLLDDLEEGEKIKIQ